MAGPGAGEARLTIEQGSTRFIVRARSIGPETTAQRLLAVLPTLEKALIRVLEDAHKRETKNAPVREHRGK